MPFTYLLSGGHSFNTRIGKFIRIIRKFERFFFDKNMGIFNLICLEKNLNFKSTIFKFLIFYACIYVFAFFLNITIGFENLIINIEYRYLALINIISIFLGLPLSLYLT